MIAGIILAAGASARMGSPKALLTYRGKTFIQHIFDTLASARILDVTVVLGHEAGLIQTQIPWFIGTVVVNPQWRDGQLSSLRKGLDSLSNEHCRGAIVCPVDHPLLSQALLVDLLHAFWTRKKDIVIPVYQGKRGHPVIFSKELFPELRKASLDAGARAVIHANPQMVSEVVTDEAGVLFNVDTPADYEALLNAVSHPIQ